MSFDPSAVRYDSLQLYFSKKYDYYANKLTRQPYSPKSYIYIFILDTLDIPYRLLTESADFFKSPHGEKVFEVFAKMQLGEFLIECWDFNPDSQQIFFDFGQSKSFNQDKSIPLTKWLIDISKVFKDRLKSSDPEYKRRYLFAKDYLLRDDGEFLFKNPTYEDAKKEDIFVPFMAEKLKHGDPEYAEYGPEGGY